MKTNQKHVLTSKQIKRRKYTVVKFYDNGWRIGYLTSTGRKWATGRKAATGSPLRLSLSDKGKSWKEISI